MSRWMGVALVIAAASSACIMPSPQESGPPIGISEEQLQFGGNGSRTAAGAAGPLPPLQRVWTFSSRTDGITGFGPPLVAYDTVFVDSDAVYAVDPTGRLRWRHPGEEDTGFVTEMALRPPLLFVGRSAEEPQRAVVDVLDARTGSLRWSWPVPDPGAGWISLVPTPTGVIVVSDGKGPNIWLVRDPGEVVWSVRTRGLPSPSFHGPGVAAGNGILVVLMQNGLEVFRISDGKFLWRKGKDKRLHPDGGAVGTYWDSPAVSGGRVLAVMHPGLGNSGLVAYSGRTGKEVGRIPHVFEYAIHGQTVYVQTFLPSRVAAYFLADFERRWQARYGRGIDNMETPPLPLEDGVLTVGADDAGFLTTLAFYLPERGLVWRQELPEVDIPGALESFAKVDPDPNALVSTGGAVLVTTNAGILYAYVPQTDS